MSIHYYHYYHCSICQQSNCCICQQLEKQIESLEYMNHQHFIQFQYWENQYNYLRRLITNLTALQPILEELNLEKQYHQFYARELNFHEKLLSDHKLMSHWYNNE